MQRAKVIVVKDVQSTMAMELRKGRKGRYARLNPECGEDGVWLVGKRLQCYNPLGLQDAPQKLLPASHLFTKLAMTEAHGEGGHRGRDATLARFRQEYWVPQGAKVAKGVKDRCQKCRLREPQVLNPEMGRLPLARLKQSPPFNNVMLDFFGPIKVRGEVQKRVSGKAYGVIFTDLYSRAVHIEATYGYDTESFLLALNRFVSIRGWPAVIYSDPGTQLVGADRELRRMWKEVDKHSLYKVGTDHGLQWMFGPTNSPWYQGAVEALVKAAKRALKFSIASQRVSCSEFMALCSHVANLLNERPLGVLPSDDSTVNILTPNCFLLGRSLARNPGGWSSNQSLRSRLALVDSMVQDFWSKWCELYAPTLFSVRRQKVGSRNLQEGDIVSVAEPSSLRREYFIAIVRQVFPSADGVVRKVAIAYKNFKVGENVRVYSGAKDTVVLRGAHRLALLVAVEE
jgi:hypothetical protein